MIKTKPCIIVQSINQYTEALAKTRWTEAESFEDGVRKTKTEKFAYLMGVAGMDTFLEEHQEPCALVKMGSNQLNGHPIIAWGKNFPYADLFNY